ncbi:hypothetical protein QJS10_CPB22g00549 [Acorus calamus]|uniref:Uncharacterized protein n=1 Tax=Acorus calamus TaxID=4465 RepID=A0AAV9C2C6_ACOCL|nr:hypothetical protein QJS10_CPB22g00549 [Acorus calamus]
MHTLPHTLPRSNTYGITYTSRVWAPRLQRPVLVLGLRPCLLYAYKGVEEAYEVYMSVETGQDGWPKSIWRGLISLSNICTADPRSDRYDAFTSFGITALEYNSYVNDRTQTTS